MKIEVLYIENCPNQRPALERLQAVLAREGVSADIAEIEVKDSSEAQALDFRGSPTIRINGLDIDAGSLPAATAGLSCRWYVGGLPSEEMIRTALHRAKEDPDA